MFIANYLIQIAVGNDKGQKTLPKSFALQIAHFQIKVYVTETSIIMTGRKTLLPWPSPLSTASKGEQL